MKRPLLLLLLMFPAAVIQSSARPESVYDKILSEKKITIGISKNYPPLNFNSGARGLEIDLARELARFMGAEPVFVALDVNEYSQSLVEGKTQVVIAGLSRNLRRAKMIFFSRPYLSITPGVLASRKALPQTRFGDEFEQPPFKTIWDLQRVHRFSFAVKEGSTYEDLIRENFPSAAIVTVKNNEEGLALLKDAKVNGFVHDSLFLEYMYDREIALRESYLLLTGGDRTEQICMGLPFGDHTMKVQVDLFIDEALRTGLIDKLMRSYK